MLLWFLNKHLVFIRVSVSHRTSKGGTQKHSRTTVCESLYKHLCIHSCILLCDYTQ